MIFGIFGIFSMLFKRIILLSGLFAAILILAKTAGAAPSQDAPVQPVQALGPTQIELVVQSDAFSTNQSVYFAGGSNDLSDEAALFLTEIASDLHTSEEALIVLAGTNDAQIDAVADELEANGIPSSWILVDGGSHLAQNM